MKNKRIRNVLMCFFICLCMLCSSLSISASRVSGSLTLSMKGNDHLEVELYRIADYENGKYVLCPGFRDPVLTKMHKELMHNPKASASQIERYTNKVVSVAHENKVKPIHKATINKEMTLKDVPLGLYLAVQIDRQNDTKKMIPSLIGVPYWETTTLADGSVKQVLVYDVIIYPKESDVPDKDKPTPPPVKPNTPPGTGDSFANQKEPYMITILCSMLGMYWIVKRLQYLNDGYEL